MHERSAHTPNGIAAANRRCSTSSRETNLFFEKNKLYLTPSLARTVSSLIIRLSRFNSMYMIWRMKHEAMLDGTSEFLQLVADYRS